MAESDKWLPVSHVSRVVPPVPVDEARGPEQNPLESAGVSPVLS